MHTVHRTARCGLSAQGQKLVYHLCGLRICGQRGQRDGHYRTPPPAAAKRLLTNRFRFAILKNSSYAAVFTRIQALCARALEILRPWAGTAHMAAFYSFARQSYKKNSCGLFFGCAARPRARPSRSFFIGSNKKESNRRGMEGGAFDLLFVRAQICGAAFSRAAVVWCAFHKAGKCVSFRLLPCVRKGRAAFVRRLPFSGFPALRPGSGHMVEKAAGAFPRPFSIGVEVYVPNHRFPSYLRL